MAVAGNTTTLFTDFFSRPSRFFTLGACAALTTSRAETVLGKNWSHIIDFNKLGLTFLGFLDFYNVKGVVECIRDIGLEFSKMYNHSDHFQNCAKTIVSKFFLGLSKTAQIIGRLEKIGAFKSRDISHFKLCGNVSGIAAHTYTAYLKYSTLAENVDGQQIQEPYRVTYQVKKYRETVAEIFQKVALVALNFFLAAGVLCEGKSTVGFQQVIGKHYKDGILASFVMITIGMLAQHCIGADRFAKQHKV